MASLADALAYQAKRSQYMDDMTEQPSDLEKAVQDQFGMQPNMDRGALLPYKSKDQGWVAPEVAYQLAKLLASPSVAMHGGNISPQEAIESGNTLSGFMTPAGLASKIEPGMAKMFIGANAKTWDKAAHAAAQEMEKSGVAPEQIWKETGTWRGPDGMWRQEIPDNAVSFNDAEKIQLAAKAEEDRIAAMRQQSRDISKGLKTQPDLFEKDLKKWNTSNRAAAKAAEIELNKNYGLAFHPEYGGNSAPIAYPHPGLYEAYPELSQIVIRQGANNRDYIGSYTPGVGGKTSGAQLDVNKAAFGEGRSPESTTAHEMQHAIQDIEGFGQGTNIDAAYRFLQSKKLNLRSIEDSPVYKEARQKSDALWDKFMNTDSSESIDEIARMHDKLYEEYPILKQWAEAKNAFLPFHNETPEGIYKRFAGEAEARATQSRLGLTQEQRRNTFPLSSYDVPIEKLIVKK